MPDIACALNEIKTNTLCADLGGLLTVFWIDETEIDWDAMALPANFDDSTYTVLNWILQGGASGFKELTFERRNGRLDALYTADNGFYEVSLLNLLFKGHSAAKTYDLNAAVGCCGIVAQVFDNNGLSRVIGKEFISGGWVDPIDKCRISRHLDTTGGFGAADDKSRDEFDITGSHTYAPAYSSVTLQTMRGV